MACTKELIATDCMEYHIYCEKHQCSQYIGLTCKCGDCEPIAKSTNNLETCPSCGSTLVLVDDEE
jgi:Zn finger protein HypA/HybF involved in hydrogenase expression